MGNVADARREMTKTKEQLEEGKKISLSIRIKPLELDGMDSDGLKAKASELWEVIVKLETEKYDEEEELKRLKEEQAKRKEIRAEQEKKLAQQKKEEEEKLRKAEAEKRAAEEE